MNTLDRREAYLDLFDLTSDDLPLPERRVLDDLLRGVTGGAVARRRLPGTLLALEARGLVQLDDVRVPALAVCLDHERPRPCLECA